MLFSQCSKQMQTIWPRARWSCLYLLMFHNTTKGWRAPRIVWTPAQVQTILGARHRLVIIFSENKGFYVALPIMVQMTQFFCTMYSLVVRLLWIDNKCRHGLCAFPNMVSNVNIMRKSAKNQEKKERHDVELLVLLRYSLHGLCAFPNMVIKVNIARKSETNRKKI